MKRIEFRPGCLAVNAVEFDAILTDMKLYTKMAKEIGQEWFITDEDLFVLQLKHPSFSRVINVYENRTV